VATSAEFLEASWANAAAGNVTPIDLESVLGTASYWQLADVRDHAARIGVPWFTVGPFSADDELLGADDGTGLDPVVLRWDAREATAYRGDTEAAITDIRGWLTDGWRVVVITEGHGLAKRVVEVLGERDLAARMVEDLSEVPETGIVHVATGGLGRGFVAPGVRLAVLTETDLTGTAGQSTKDMRRMPSRRRNMVDPLQLRTGDFVVHEQHGVGRFVEMTQRTVAGATREYLVLEYASSKRGQPADRLFVPSDSLDQVTRYVGGEAPTLNRLGGSDWAKTKGRARKAVKQIAGELIRLYSARMASPGHAFGPDTPWQRELEDAFAYVETPDQLASIDEVKADMERPVPDGPADLRRRRLRQDRDRGAGGLQGGAGRQAGRDPGADHAAGAAAPADLRRAVRELPGGGQGALAVPVRQGGQGRQRRPPRRHCRRGDRHPPAAHGGGAVQGPRADHRRRGAALRRRAQGAAQSDAHGGGRAGHERHADPAHPRDGRDRHP
jgi:hypothetical protein